MPSLIDVSNRVEPAKLRLPGNKFDLSAITSVAPTVHQMAIRTDAVEAAVDRLPAHTWLGPVDSAKNSLVSSLTSLDHTLHGLDNAVQIAPTMLGASGTKRYFVGLENEAESRGIGGIPGSFGIVEATDGVVKVDQFYSDSELDGVKVNVDYGSDFAQRYSYEDPTGQYIWSDISPNFPYGAGIWAAMWEQKTGQHIDGALALDPTALRLPARRYGPGDGGRRHAGHRAPTLFRSHRARFTQGFPPSRTNHSARRFSLASRRPSTTRFCTAPTPRGC